MLSLGIFGIGLFVYILCDFWRDLNISFMELVGVYVIVDVKFKVKKMIFMNLLIVVYVFIFCSFKVYFVNLKFKKD